MHMAKTAWTDERNNRVRDVFATRPDLSSSELDRLLADELGCTAAAVSRQRQILGIRHSNPKAHQGKWPGYQRATA